MTSKNFIFFKKEPKFRQKKTQKCWVILYQHLCVFSGYMSDPLWGFLIQYPHIFLYTNIQSPSPYAMLSYTQMSHVTPCFIILRSTARHPIKIWCIYLKIIKFYLISIFWINIHDEFDETLKLCGPRTHIQQSWISRFNFFSRNIHISFARC